MCYSPDEIDALARYACETVVAEPGKVCPYDVEAFRRIERRPVPTGEYPLYEPPAAVGGPLPDLLPQECVSNEPYHLRIGGFRRADVFGPDEAANAISSAGIKFSDSLGEGLFEHLVLCRKYGVTPVFEAPAMGFPFPFLENELPTFERLYRREVEDFSDWIKRAEAVFGKPILQAPRQPWVLWGLLSPLALFMQSATRKPSETSVELNRHSGASRLSSSPASPEERATQLQAWAFLRRRHMEVRAIMARSLREVIATNALLIDNTHVMPIVDFERLGEIYDHPGVAVRSGYLDEEHLREPNVAFGVRLFHDLTGKSPIVSVRINTTAAGTRFIAGHQAIRNWTDCALRHGAAGFYFWPVDYPSQDGQYFGALPGNTDPSSRGKERWLAQLELFRQISSAQRFRPPWSKIGILVAPDLLDLSAWKRVFTTFVELENARIFARFISSRRMGTGDNSLDKFEVVVLPACPFLSNSHAKLLENYVADGGNLIISCPEALQYDEAGQPRSTFAGLSLPFANGDSRAHGKGNIFLTDNVVRSAGALRLTNQDWIYNIQASSLRELTGVHDSSPIVDPDPNVNVKHYLYEHSSKAIMPYVEKVTRFPTDKDI